MIQLTYGGSPCFVRADKIVAITIPGEGLRTLMFGNGVTFDIDDTPENIAKLLEFFMITLEPV